MSGKLIVLLIIAICAIVLLAFNWPVRAAGCTDYDTTVAAIEAQGSVPFFIAPARLPKVVKDAEALTGQTIAGTPTRGFLVFGGTVTVLGLEVDKCLLDPIYIRVPTPSAHVQPGASKSGVGA